MAIRRAVDFDIVYTHILSAAESKQTRSVRHANESESVWLVCNPLQYSHHMLILDWQLIKGPTLQEPLAWIGLTNKLVRRDHPSCP